MVIFGFSAMYFVPVFSFLFVWIFLKAIEKIVHKRKYTAELFWSCTMFALTMWTISVMTILQ
ncbi:hypothetical protein GGC63_001849 [Paenibacillus sp. OAS669]|nr:hypothetical protein [Paenibacillus sp. OAS669]